MPSKMFKSASVLCIIISLLLLTIFLVSFDWNFSNSNQINITSQVLEFGLYWSNAISLGYILVLSAFTLFWGIINLIIFYSHPSSKVMRNVTAANLMFSIPILMVASISGSTEIMIAYAAIAILFLLSEISLIEKDIESTISDSDWENL